MGDNRSSESIRLLDQMQNDKNEKAANYIKQKIQKSKYIVVHRKDTKKAKILRSGSDDDIDEMKQQKIKKTKKKKREFTKETDHECVGKHLLVKCPNDLFLMSESNENEGNTEGDIKEMG